MPDLSHLLVPRTQSTRLLITVIAIFLVVGTDVASTFGVKLSDGTLTFIQYALGLLVGADTLRPLGFRGFQVQIGPSATDAAGNPIPKVAQQGPVTSTRAGFFNPRLALVLVAILFVPAMMGAKAPSGCHKSIVSDANTYQSELSWLQARNTEATAALLQAASDAHTAGNDAACRTYADAGLVQKYGVSYRLSMMAYLADLGDNPGDAQAIPTADAICGTPSGDSDTPSPSDSDTQPVSPVVAPATPSPTDSDVQTAPSTTPSG